MPNPAERLGLYRNIRKTIQDGVWVDVHYSTEIDCPDCAFDEISQSAVKVNCVTCKGRGRVHTAYQGTSLARVIWRGRPDMDIAIGGAVLMGDAVILADLRDKALYEKVEQDNEGYLKIGSRTVRPVLIHEIVGRHEIAIACEIVNKTVLRP